MWHAIDGAIVLCVVLWVAVWVGEAIHASPTSGELDELDRGGE